MWYEHACKGKKCLYEVDRLCKKNTKKTTLPQLERETLVSRSWCSFASAANATNGGHICIHLKCSTPEITAFCVLSSRVLLKNIKRTRGSHKQARRLASVHWYNWKAAAGEPVSMKHEMLYKEVLLVIFWLPS